MSSKPKKQSSPQPSQSTSEKETTMITDQQQQPQGETTVQDAGQPEQTQETTSGTVVGDASGDVGQVQAEVVERAQSFAEVVASVNQDNTAAELFIVGYSDSLTKHLLSALSDESQIDRISKDAIKFVLEYAAEMGPTAGITQEFGHQMQTNLVHNLLSMINSGSDTFRTAFSMVLAIVNESIKNGTGFSGTLPFRYMESIAMHAEKRSALTNLVHVLITTADPATRAASTRQIDLPRAAKYGMSEQGKQALIGFYTV